MDNIVHHGADFKSELRSSAAPPVGPHRLGDMRLAVFRAYNAASEYESGTVPTLKAAAAAWGTTTTYASAALVSRSADRRLQSLLERVVRGRPAA